ncbi:hypothetical protein DTO195F2_554 [Paecilomyces variotii]|nr:hypothetical protein DTO195F2_554 [Paecilomyces variotii]KAJ9374941.1 hypothetical protein DTO282E5_496 [Paecilomyces variotii]
MKISWLSSLLAAVPVIALPPHPAAPQSPLQLEAEATSNTQNRLKEIISASPLLSFHRDIVEIPSISGNEGEVGDFIIRFLKARNFIVEKQIVPPYPGRTNERFNIYAYPASSPSPEILLTSHIDTVPPYIPYSLSYPESSPSGSIDRDEILISGRGTVDDKAAVAAQIFAVLSHLQKDPEASLGLLFVVGEEKGGDGMKFFSDSSLNTAPPTFHTVIFGEPTELALVSGHKGMVFFRVTAKGKAAHSGYPWLGQSAVSSILPALAIIDKLGDIPVEEGGLPSSPKYGKTTLNIGFVQGGVATNVVPASAVAEVAVRLAAGTVEEAQSIIAKAVFKATNGDDSIEIEFGTEGNGYSPQDLDTDVEGFNVTTVNYGTDVPNLYIHQGAGGSGHGRVKRYLYGPGSIFVAHGDNEGLKLWHIEEAVKGYGRLIDAAIKRNE